MVTMLTEAVIAVLFFLALRWAARKVMGGIAKGLPAVGRQAGKIAGKARKS